MEASQDLLSQQLTEARRRGDSFSASVRSLLENYGGFAPELIESLVSHAYEEEYDRALNDELTEAEGQVIDLGVVRIDPIQVQLEMIALGAFSKILSGEFSAKERQEREKELMEVDYKTPAETAVKTPVIARTREVSRSKTEPIEIYLGNVKLNETQRFLLEHLGDVDPKRFTRKDFMKLGFGAGKTEGAANQAFVKDMTKITILLETLAGEPVILKEGVRGGLYYHLAAKVELVSEE